MIDDESAAVRGAATAGRAQLTTAERSGLWSRCRSRISSSAHGLDHASQPTTPYQHHTTTPTTTTTATNSAAFDMGAGASLVSNIAGSGTEISIPKIVNWLR